MRIANWNLQRVAPGQKRERTIRKWIEAQAADIWVLTETHLEFGPGPDYKTVASGEPERPGIVGERWVMIWARAANVESVETSDPVRTACALVSFGAGRKLLVYGTVLPWLGSSWRDVPAKNGAAFAASLGTQADDWGRLRVAYPSVPLVVVGDLNQDLNETHYYGSRKNRQLLARTLAHKKLQCVTSGPFDPIFQLSNGQRGNIDHICLDQNLVVDHEISAWTWPDSLKEQEALSDHFGVGVGFNFRTPSNVSEK